MYRKLALLASIALLILASPTYAHASTSEHWITIPKSCGNVKKDVGLTKAKKGTAGKFAAGKYRDFGISIPVIFVHGYDGMDKGQWGSVETSGDFIARFDGVNGTRVATEFQYDTGHGVYDTDFRANFQPLANAIDCFAQISKDNGGIGKVIVVGYSQGSSTIHGASNLRSSDGQRLISDEIGQVVSIADARVAHPLTKQGARWFQSGYDAPDIPDGVIVHAVAGSVIDVIVNKNGRVLSTHHIASDGMIDVVDATAQYTSDWDTGGGVFVAECKETYIDKLGGRHSTPFNDKCEHGNLLKNGRIQNDVISAVQLYADYANPIVYGD